MTIYSVWYCCLEVFNLFCWYSDDIHKFSQYSVTEEAIQIHSWWRPLTILFDIVVSDTDRILQYCVHLTSDSEGIPLFYSSDVIHSIRWEIHLIVFDDVLLFIILLYCCILIHSDPDDVIRWLFDVMMIFWYDRIRWRGEPVFLIREYSMTLLILIW